MSTDVFDPTTQPDYNPKDTIVFQKNPLIGLVIARLPKSTLSLYWCGGLGDGGDVFIGRPLLGPKDGGYLTRVTNPDYDYAFDEKAFRALAQRFDDEATKEG
jgi:hypothetical protein